MDRAVPAQRVLVVEDEPVLAGVVGNYLSTAGFEVRLCGDGGTAVELVRAWVPDVVVLDLGFPVLDGVEVCRQLRTFSDCYVVMLTARSDEVDKLVGLSVGPDDYLTKPVQRAEARRTGSGDAAPSTFGDDADPSAGVRSVGDRSGRP